MATRSNVRPAEPTIDEMNAVFPPDEINDETPTTNGRPAIIAGLSLDELDARGIDEERDEQERAKIDPPSGNWLKEAKQKWTYEKRVYPNDKHNDDRDPSGRTVLNFYGKPAPREDNNITYQPTLFLRISPDCRYKQEAGREHEHDNSYKLWLGAKDLFVSMYGRRPRISEIVTMLTEEEYIVRTMKGDSGPIVVSLQDPNQERVRANRRNRRTQHQD